MTKYLRLLALIIACPFTNANAVNLAWDSYPTATTFWVWDVTTSPRTLIGTVTTNTASVQATAGHRVSVSAGIPNTAGGLTESQMSASVVIPSIQTIVVQFSSNLTTWSVLRTDSVMIGAPGIAIRPDGPWLVDDSRDILLIEPKPNVTRFYRIKLP